MSRLRSLGIAALLAATCLGAPSAAVADDAPLALVGATVHSVARPSEVATVLVVGRRIRAVGPDLPIPDGARRVDLSGRHLYPGLIDADTVLGLTEIGSVKGTQDAREVGATTPDLRAELGVNPDSELLGVARTGGVLLAHVAARSGLVSGTSAVIATDGWTVEDMTVRAPVFMYVRWPAMRVPAQAGPKAKPREERLRDREAALRRIDEAFAEAAAYWQARESGDPHPVEADVQWEAMRPVLAGRVPVAVVANRAAQIRAALDWARRRGVRLVLVGAADGWRLADELARLDVPVVLGPVERLPLRRYEPVNIRYENAARLHAAGVRIAFSTGESSFHAANARNLRRHAALAVGHGLPASVALRALTQGAAEILGIDARVGSIEPDKDATLIVTDRDLFDATSRVTQAWIAGQAVDLRDRQLRLYERYRDRPSAR